MKKVVSMMLVAVMVMGLSACKVTEPTTEQGTSVGGIGEASTTEPSKAVDSTGSADPWGGYEETYDKETYRGISLTYNFAKEHPANGPLLAGYLREEFHDDSYGLEYDLSQVKSSVWGNLYTKEDREAGLAVTIPFPNPEVYIYGDYLDASDTQQHTEELGFGEYPVSSNSWSGHFSLGTIDGAAQADEWFEVYVPASMHGIQYLDELGFSRGEADKLCVKVTICLRAPGQADEYFGDYLEDEYNIYQHITYQSVECDMGYAIHKYATNFTDEDFASDRGWYDNSLGIVRVLDDGHALVVATSAEWHGGTTHQPYVLTEQDQETLTQYFLDVSSKVAKYYGVGDLMDTLMEQPMVQEK